MGPRFVEKRESKHTPFHSPHLIQLLWQYPSATLSKRKSWKYSGNEPRLSLGLILYIQSAQREANVAHFYLTGWICTNHLKLIWASGLKLIRNVFLYLMVLAYSLLVFAAYCLSFSMPVPSKQTSETNLIQLFQCLSKMPLNVQDLGESNVKLQKLVSKKAPNNLLKLYYYYYFTIMLSI